ncbi:MAG: NAD(P)H-quinone oxidoreductase subunit I, chloroplastic [Gammaproteobacteria bacterium]|nr:NAD(P)H-quinone oxidoreductase subunit I, chloroplastic [Gammaproteobacteria bacterium]
MATAPGKVFPKTDGASEPSAGSSESPTRSTKTSDIVREDAGIHPLMGNEAIARGVWEAGVRVATAYPGTPSTEILEAVARFPGEDIDAEWATNEKVAFDIAIGTSFAGERSFVAMKHVGLNVAMDALMSVTYIGVNGGLVAAVCDDPGIHSSQNEQDTRLVARLAQVPVLEPTDAQEALDYCREAFDISESYDTPVIVRSTTRLSHTRSLVKVGQRREPAKLGFREDPEKNVILPAHARRRHPLVLERERKLVDFADHSPLNRREQGGKEFGVITCGIAYSYIKESLPDASILKLGMTYPMPDQLLRDFCASVDRVIVVEELEPLIEDAVRLLGFEVDGKNYFPRVGEFSPSLVRAGLEKAGVLKAKTTVEPGFRPEALPRPPVLCAGCPHTGSYMALRAVDARVAGDIGCYTLAAIEPLRAIDTCVAMGSCIGNAVGIAKTGTESRPIVATLGDSTFLHAGIPPLIDAVYNQANIAVLILDNHTVAMTGGQHHAGTGFGLRGNAAPRADFEQIVAACGVKWVRSVDSYNLSDLYRSIVEATQYKGVAVVISNRPCVLDPVKIKGDPYQVNSESCTGCQACMNLGCPALRWNNELFDGHHRVMIDAEACIGCSLCAQVCPTDAIHLSARH